ncbi:MAG TPA: PqqD family protein [Gaiellaceae bacterium]|nr:PqqD family protein [Gaiellaceae bacterium]
MAATKPRVRDDVTVCEIEGEAVVYDPDSGLLHYLNHSAALVLDLCDGTATMRHMAEAIADVYEVCIGDVEPQVRSGVRNLRKLGLLEPPAGRRTSAEDGPTAAAPKASDADADERERIRMEVPRNA